MATPHPHSAGKKLLSPWGLKSIIWSRGLDLNQRPSGYEAVPGVKTRENTREQEGHSWKRLRRFVDSGFSGVFSSFTLPWPLPLARP